MYCVGYGKCDGDIVTNNGDLEKRKDASIASHIKCIFLRIVSLFILTDVSGVVGFQLVHPLLGPSLTKLLLLLVTIVCPAAILPRRNLFLSLVNTPFHVLPILRSPCQSPHLLCLPKVLRSHQWQSP